MKIGGENQHLILIVLVMSTRGQDDAGLVIWNQTWNFLISHPALKIRRDSILASKFTRIQPDSSVQDDIMSMVVSQQILAKSKIQMDSRRMLPTSSFGIAF